MDWTEESLQEVRCVCSAYGLSLTFDYNLLRVHMVGDVMYLQIFKQPVLVLGDPDSITEFFEKRSANTSDRKQTPSMSLYVPHSDMMN